MHISDSHCEIVKFSIYVVVIFVFRGVFFQFFVVILQSWPRLFKR